MSSTPNPPERPSNPTHYGSEGLYESTGIEQETSLRTRLSEHVDSATRQSLQLAQRSTSALRDYVRSNPIPVLLAVGGLALLFTFLSRRRSTRY